MIDTKTTQGKRNLMALLFNEAKTSGALDYFERLTRENPLDKPQDQRDMDALERARTYDAFYSALEKRGIKLTIQS